MLAHFDPLMESVIKITENQSKKDLCETLTSCVASLVDFKGVVLLLVPRDSSAGVLEVGASVPSAVCHELYEKASLHQGAGCVKRDATTASCITNGEIVTQQQGGKSRVLFPVLINREVVLVLDVHGCEHDSVMERDISSLLIVFSNFLALIEDNERDPLTGLLNRKTFDAQLSDLLSVVDEKRDPDVPPEMERRTSHENLYHWIGIIDIDHFKNINDKHGHVLGDEVLILFANLIKKSFRNSDLLFRYGGEEFVVVLSPLAEADACSTFERFRQLLEAREFPQVGQVTASIGMVSIDQREHQSLILEKADKALYYAKENGRNRVCNYHQLIEQGRLVARQVQSDIELF